MLTTRAATPEDLAGFEIDMRQARVMPGWHAALAHFISIEVAIAAVYRRQVIAFAGITPIWPGRATTWCFLSADFPMRAWVPATRAARLALDRCGIARVEADIRTDYPPAARWARLLGFEDEGEMRAYWGGATYTRFARISA